MDTKSTKNDITSDQTVISFSEERSVFERAIIEAFKQKGSKQIFEKLSIALDEIKFIVLEIKKSSAKTKKYILNKNILDKLSRIIERKYFNVNILVAKIYENILDPYNFDILSSDVNLLINFSNEVLNLLEEIKSTIVSRQLEKKCSSFLNYIQQIEGISEEQKQTINELLSGFPTRHSSNVYKTFDELKDKISRLAKNSNNDDKMEALTLLIENYGNTCGLEEQFDLLIEKVAPIIKAIIHQPNPEYKEAYFQLGNFICSVLFATKFKIEAYLPDYKINHKEINKNFFFFLAGDELVDESTKYHISFLQNTIYELTTQKETLIKCENIFVICNLIVNTLSIYDSIFDLQFVCYIILKRVYFTFPQFRKNIEDALAVTLINLCMFKDPFEVENSEECKVFLHFLLENGEEDLKHKIQKRIEARAVNITLKHELEDQTKKEVEYEFLKLSDFNLRIGYPNSFEIEAGAEISSYIEVIHANSLVYIGFATYSNDISFNLLKYIPNEEEEKQEDLDDDDSLNNVTSEENEELTDKGHFKLLLKLERIDCSLTPVKCVLFVPEPGTYKIVFDNNYSWFTSKVLRYRISVLKPLSEIDLTRRVEFEKMKNVLKTQEKRILDSDYNQPEKKEGSNHDNKILMVKLDGVNKSFNLGRIYNTEKMFKEYNTYITLPIIFSKDSFRLLVSSTDEHGQTNYDFREFKVETNELESEKEIKSLPQLFEDEMSNYISNINDLNKKVVFLSSFVLDKNNSNNEVIPVTNDETYKIIFNKLGFFPENLLSKYENVRFFSSNLADACLLYSLYEKILKEESFGNIIHIHFDKIKTQASLYFEGVINDKISGLNYDYNKTLLENVDNVFDFVGRVVLIFGSFTLSVSSSDVDDKYNIII
jgi:hypothetical protein